MIMYSNQEVWSSNEMKYSKLQSLLHFVPVYFKFSCLSHRMSAMIYALGFPD